MASCHGCGKHPLRKNKAGEFRCRRCGPKAPPLTVILARRAALSGPSPEQERLPCA